MNRSMNERNRLEQQLQFIMEIDRLKTILRQSLLTDQSRRENSAEHSWHLAMMALMLREHANEAHVDICHVIKILLVHDLVEIDAGDTFAYDDVGNESKVERELAAAKRIFGLLPKEQEAEVFALWQEYEQGETIEAQFACSLDRLQPMLHNYYTKGASWQKHGITKEQVIKKNQVIANGSERLWDYASRMIDDAVAKGFLQEKRNT